MSEETENFEDAEKTLTPSSDEQHDKADSETVAQVNQIEETPVVSEALTPISSEFSPEVMLSEQKLSAFNPTEKLTLPEKQEQTRSQLATFLLRILAGTLISSLALILSLIYISTNVDEKKAATFDKTSALVKDLITFVITSQVGLIGTALGFYFGSKNNSD